MEIKPLILIVEDDKPIRNFISVSMKTQGYDCIETESGEMAIALVTANNPDVIIVDLGLPDIDGFEVIKAVRPMTDSAIIVVSARGKEREKVSALDLGADDYLTKPFSVPELLARIRVALRHAERVIGSSEEIKDEFRLDELEINYAKRQIFLKGEELHLTPIEYKLLVLLSQNAGKVLTHKHIQKEVWGAYAVEDTRSLRVFMANIRRKIERDPAQPRYIITEVGVGYRMVDE